ncbi:hypothetical protein NLJ89_g5277 [Agrocybe chaxingu]|uniref:Uncharacterized protein n=1 Tax=Agrocybe chaxingu TaxID=84603 RepID=A0A9W8MV55_9AGAR|nr:hypothetical protein NLJ89_g5277 [Agrocybe chaxingu]
MHFNLLPPPLATLLFLAVQQCAGFTIDVKPEAPDGNCRVSQNIFTNINPARGDPQVVDIFLFDGSVNKEVPLSFGARLDPKGSSFALTVPEVPPGYPFAVRLKRPNSEQLLQDSSPFPILPTLGGVLTAPPSSVTSRSSPTTTSTTFTTLSDTASSFATEATTSSIPIDQSATSPTGPPPRPITAILGPVFGVLSFFALCLAGCFWLWRRCRIKRRKARQQQVLSNMERATVTRSVAKQPYVTLPSESSSELPKDLEAGSKSSTISSEFESESKSKGSSSSKSRRFSHNSLFPESSSAMPSQPDVLRHERARVYEEIAALERRSELLQSSSNPFADPGSDITTRDILQQLTALKTRIRELEELHAQQQSRRPTSSSTSADPPPEYVPPHPADHVPAHDGNSKTQCFCASCT